MKLHFHPKTASSRRVELYLAEKGLEIPHELVDIKSRAHDSEAYRRLNPGGTVPVLELDDGTALSETMAICRYLELLHPEPPLFGTTPLEQARVEMWNRRIELEGTLPCFDAFRNADPAFDGRARAGWSDGLSRIPELVERAPLVVGRLFGWLERELAERPWVVGDHFSVADLTLLVTVDIARRLGVVPGELSPALAAWRARIGAREAILRAEPNG